MWSMLRCYSQPEREEERREKKKKNQDMTKSVKWLILSFNSTKESDRFSSSAMHC